MAIPGFDENQLNTELGLSTDTTIRLDDNGEGQFAMNPDDRAALEKIAGQAPTGIQVTPPTKLPPVPDYLAPHIPTPPATPVQREEKDWGKLWESTFGAPAPENVTPDRSNYELAVVRKHAYDEFIGQKPELTELRAITAGSITPIEVVQNAVKAELQRSGIRSNAVFDNEMKEYVDESGELTDSGKQRLESEKQLAQRQLSRIEQLAGEHADGSVDSLNKFYDVLESTGATFKPFGIALPESMVSDMQEDIRSGRTDAWLENAQTPEEAAEKSYRLALVSDDARWAEFIRLADERGQQYGANRRIGSQLSN